jgi:hypothetical protein
VRRSPLRRNGVLSYYRRTLLRGRWGEYVPRVAGKTAAGGRVLFRCLKSKMLRGHKATGRRTAAIRYECRRFQGLRVITAGVGRVERMRASRRGVYAVGRVGVWSWSKKWVATIPGRGSDGVSSNAGAVASPRRALAPRPAAPYNVGSSGKLRLVGVCSHAST